MHTKEFLIREIHHIGRDTPEQIVGRGACPAMTMRGISAVGMSDAGVGYRMARRRPAYAHMVICTGGRGRVWIEGGWTPCTPGMAYLSPPLVDHAFETVGRQRWKFCWIYHEPDESRPPLISGDRPILIRCDPRPIRLAIEGMYLESVTSAEPAVLDQWLELIRAHVMRLTGPFRVHDRLWRVWADVGEDLARPWTLADLAQRAGLSSEQVRRLCTAHLGRSPMQQVTQLRMQRAAALLNATPHKLHTIARTVGYENAFTFSTAFKRWAGRSPSTFRKSSGTA